MKKLIALFFALALLPSLAHAVTQSQAPVVTVLNTTIGENGTTQTTDLGYQKHDFPLRFVADLGAGDTYVVQGRATASDSWVTIYTFTADEWKDIWVPLSWRVIRSVDGGADGTVKVINAYSIVLDPHD